MRLSGLRVAAVLVLVLVFVILVASPSFAQMSRPLVYIQPQQGFEARLAASIARKNVPIDVITDRDGATYFLSVSPIRVSTDSECGWEGFFINDASAAVELSDRTSRRVVWVYSVRKPTEGRKTDQAVADDIAEHLKKFVRKNRGVLGGGVQLQQSHGLATLFGRTRELFLIPEGYKGDVYVVYGASDGESLSETRGEVIYRIPEDGILRIREPMPSGSTGTEYYYEQRDGSLQFIPTVRAEFGPPTIPLMPASLMNDGPVRASFPHTRTFRDSAVCMVHLKQFYVGTTGNRLSKYRQIDLDRYIRENPVFCSK